MENRRLVVEARTKKGTAESGRLRRQGWVPGIMYGAGEESVTLAIPQKELVTLLRETHGEMVLIDLKIGEDSKLVTLQDIQRDPVTGEVVHVDFLVLHKGKPVEVDVPVVITGTASGIKMGGILDFITRVLSIRALPKDIPPHVEVDVSALEIGNVIHVKDLVVPNVTVLDSPDEPVVSMLAPRAVVVEAVEAEEVPEGEVPPEGEPGAEAKPEEGEEAQ